MHNKRKIFFCPKESIFIPLAMSSPPLRMHVLENFTKEELLVFRDMQLFIAQKWLQNCRTLSFLVSCPTNISNIFSHCDSKKCFLRKESFLTEEFQIVYVGAPVVAQRLRTWLVSMRMWVWSLASLSRLRIWHCYKRWHRLQKQLKSDVAVVVV